MATKASIQDVAQRAGVSRSSVSRVLSGAPHVTEALRARVMDAVNQLNYKPNYLARSLRHNATRTIGMIVGEIGNPSFGAIISGAESVLRQRHYSLLIADSESKASLDCANIQMLAERQVDGLLVSLCSEEYEPTFNALRASTIPAVFVDREPRRAVSSGVVLTDHRAGMRTAVTHLASLGHRRFGFAGGIDVRPARERLAAIRGILDDLGPDYSVKAEFGAFSEAAGVLMTRAMLDDPVPATAIIFGGDPLLVGGLRELNQRGLSIPRDVSVVSCDQSAVTRVVVPELACVTRDLPSLGRKAAEMILAVIEDGLSGASASIPTGFDRGESCAAPALASARAQSAWTNN